MKIFLIFCYHILLGLGQGFETVEHAKYCVSDSPLDTPYFVPFYKTVRPALGCARAPENHEKTEVHVVRLNQPEDDVFLYVTGSNNQTELSLVLATPVPVTWHLTVSGLAPAPAILISDGSRVIDTATGLELPVSAAILNNKIITENLARAKFSHIHTFTSITAANRIFINLKKEETTSQHCDISQESAIKSVEAFFVQKQNTFGCYHTEAAGLLPNDVHVIDLKEKIVKRSTNEQSGITDVVLELSPDQSVQDLLPRNLTLILKSDKPVRWIIKSKGIKGQLIIAAGNNEVVNLSNNPDQELDLRKATIPDAFDSLIKEVTSSYGLPLSYIQFHKANLLEMLIPPRSKRELSSLYEMDMPAYVRDDDLFSHGTEEEEDKIFLVAEEIESVMTKECDEEHKSVSVRVPVEMITKYGIGSMTLNDPSCVPAKTESEWRLSSHSTRCGSIALSYGLSPMYRNNLNIAFTEGPFAGRKTKVPFICKFKPGIPGIPVREDDYEDHYDEDPYHEPDLEEEEEMYGLKVQLLSEDDDEKRATLLETRSDSTTAAVGDKIYVSSHINAVPYLALAMEQCWLTNTSKVVTHASERDQTLVTRGCPTSEAISLHWEKGSSNSAFSFQITEELVGSDRFWIQCRMGLCSATNAGARGNIHRCVNPELDCVGEHEHQESSLQQITIRGPLHIIPVTRNTLEKRQRPIIQEKIAPGARGEPDDTDLSTQASHTLVEVPVEVAVAIALASFIVGAMSTGVLWFLHSKAMQAKARRLRQFEGQELQSMLGHREGQGGSRGQKHHQHPHHHPEVEVVDGTRENPPGDLNCNTTDCTVTPLI